MKTAQELNSLALKTRRIWGEDGYSPIDIFSIINGWKEKKITLVKYPMSERISGMCTKEGNDIIICINSKTSYGRQRFTLAHELYHVLYEDGLTRAICNMGMNGSRSDSEREADKFASYLLMPYDALLQYEEKKGGWNIESVIEAEQFYQISHQAMIYRLEFDKRVDDDFVEKLKGIKVSRRASQLGYGMELYFSTDKAHQYFTTGEYIRKVERLEEAGFISNGKKEELLLDAYRADIVFDFDEGAEGLND